MTFVFRVDYHTKPGESLALKLMILRRNGNREERKIPMNWRDDKSWQTRVESGDAVEIRYSYQYSDERSGVILDEWHAPRVRKFADHQAAVHVFVDTWCSAGTVDYAYETKAFPSPSREFSEVPGLPGATHTFRIRIAGLPLGGAPCVIGNTPGLGSWNEKNALPLVETAENLWQAAAVIAPDFPLEYKYGILCRQSGAFLGYEEETNRFLHPQSEDQGAMIHVSDEGFRHSAGGLFRGTGVAIPVFSLRSDDGLGVGEFADLKPFADWVAATGMRMIQILPINDTSSSHSWADSYPYSAISVNALHPIYLRIADLPYAMDDVFHREAAALRKRLNKTSEVDYEAVMAAKHRLAKTIFDHHGAAISNAPGYLDFVAENQSWLFPYAAFCVLRDRFQTADFNQWTEGNPYAENHARALAQCEGGYHIWLQYELDRQLTDAKAHLHHLGVALKGDLPIGIHRHSVDAWTFPHLFHMHAQAGAPPDAFAQKGQNWGFPTYHWEEMQKDGYAWWRGRFARLSKYFDAFRLDHILGFFRIWQIPLDQVEGIMGRFDPATPISLDEFANRGIAFDFARFCRPYIRRAHIVARFGEFADAALRDFFETADGETFHLRPHVATQRKIVDHFAALPANAENPVIRRHEILRDGLLECAAEVLFFEVADSGGNLFHPRCAMETTASFQELGDELRWKLKLLHDDYFHRRHEDFWKARGYEKLPAMRHASRMLLCGEDLGMVPDCVPGVLKDLGILSLEIQRMPKHASEPFSDPRAAPYLSVVSPGTHDMSTLRGWWREDQSASARFAWHALGIAIPPADLSPDIAASIIAQHLESPAMWAIFPLQDLLALDTEMRHPDPQSGRINIPAITPFHWDYRCHLTIRQLATANRFNDRIHTMIAAAGRAIPDLAP